MKTTALATSTLYAIRDRHRILAGVVVDLDDRYLALRYRADGARFQVAPRGSILVAVTAADFRTAPETTMARAATALGRTAQDALSPERGGPTSDGTYFDVVGPAAILGPWDAYVAQAHADQAEADQAAAVVAATRAATATRDATIRGRLARVGVVPTDTSGHVRLTRDELEHLLDLLEAPPA